MKNNIVKRFFLYIAVGILVASNIPVFSVSALDTTFQNWKLTIPIGAKEIKQPQLATYSDDWFHKAPDGSGQEFYVDSGANGVGTTSNSSNPRSELREMTDSGKNEASWASSDGTHRMIIRQKVTELSGRGHVVIGQIHDAEDDVTVFRLEKNQLWITDGDKTHGNNLGTVNIGQVITVGFDVSGGVIKYFYSATGETNPPTIAYSQKKSFKGAYFKAGNYYQGGTDGGKSRVIILGLGVTHDGSMPDASGGGSNSSTTGSSCDSSMYDAGFYGTNDILYYDPCGSEVACEANPSDTSTTLIGGDNFEKIYNYFISKGLTPEAVAGVLGNIKQESGGDPENTQTGYTPDRTKDPNEVSGNPQGGWGLIQWSPAKKILDVAKSANINGPIYELSTQLNIVWWHMNNSSPTGAKNMISSYKDITNVAQATKEYEQKMEGADPTKVNIEDRITYAQNFLDKFSSNTSTGNPVSSTTTGDTTASSNCDSNLGMGQGDFTDNGEVAGYSTVLANAQYADKTYNGAFYQKGVCAAITSVVWHGALKAYGYEHAIDLWNANKSIGHADKTPKKGALLLYSASDPSGHVVIYLGNNKILNDGKIVDAKLPETSWGMKYLGWIDPNDLHWSTKPIGNLSTDEVRTWIKGSVPNANI